MGAAKSNETAMALLIVRKVGLLPFSGGCRTSCVDAAETRHGAIDSQAENPSFAAAENNLQAAGLAFAVGQSCLVLKRGRLDRDIEFHAQQTAPKGPYHQWTAYPPFLEPCSPTNPYKARALIENLPLVDVAQVSRLIHSGRQAFQMKEVHHASGRARFGVFEADLVTGALRKRGLRIRLQDQPFQVLAMLLEQPGVVDRARNCGREFGARTLSSILITDLVKQSTKSVRRWVIRQTVRALLKPLLAAATVSWRM
jgi:hypothetical protein